MSEKMVRYTWDTLPKPTEAERDEQSALIDAMRDEDIDLSDAPELTEAQWANAVRGRFYRPVKTPVTLRLDADVIDWFKAQAEGRGYQTEINRVLRDHVIGAAGLSVR